jgi:hypothetical protein
VPAAITAQGLQSGSKLAVVHGFMAWAPAGCFVPHPVLMLPVWACKQQHAQAEIVFLLSVSRASLLLIQAEQSLAHWHTASKAQIRSAVAWLYASLTAEHMGSPLQQTMCLLAALCATQV